MTCSYFRGAIPMAEVPDRYLLSAGKDLPREPRVRYYHRTSGANAASIMRDGFVDAESATSTKHMFRGVWISEGRLDDVKSMTDREVLLAIDVDDPKDCARINTFEWTDDSSVYRKWLVPAKLLNLVASVSIVAQEYLSA